VIFVTVGTHHQPFQRMLDGLTALDPGDLVVQHGPGAAPPGVARAAAYMPFDEMLQCFRDADKVITHAGVGSILCATRAGHKPLVVPRRHDLGEHVDEHQAELTEALALRGSVIAVRDMADLPDLLEAAPARRPEAIDASDRRLPAAVRAALLG
jgi:UDP-N-acetylglucosamine--N-acetylmuramyl-(pentapeptide) pyrophosphoryl-undecaprenol N-acetylglucosamine transferase